GSASCSTCASIESVDCRTAFKSEHHRRNTGTILPDHALPETGTLASFHRTGYTSISYIYETPDRDWKAWFAGCLRKTGYRAMYRAVTRNIEVIVEPSFQADE